MAQQRRTRGLYRQFGAVVIACLKTRDGVQVPAELLDECPPKFSREEFTELRSVVRVTYRRTSALKQLLT